jgi:peptidoglycan glycosyltransferase
MNMQEFMEREREKAKRNRIKNRPIVLMTYVMVLTFLAMFGYVIYFVATKSDTIVANSANKRQDSFDKFVKRGDIVTSDDVVVATSLYDDEGNEYRNYPYGGLFAHTVGYNSYGRAGIELAYNFDLMRSHVNVVQKLGNDLANNKNPGDTIVTTLNYGLQSAAAEAMGDVKGAAVVMDASTGDILVMYSSPTFDPNYMDYVWETVHSDEGSESTVLLNRCTQGMYAPGSTFKVLTAIEYLKEHPDYEDYTHTCYGEDIFNDVSIRCSESTAHGDLDLAGSLAASCNTSFANIGVNEINMNKLHDTAERFLFNKSLPYEAGEYNKSEFVLDGSSDITMIPQTVIGQGDTLITPLHNAMIMQSIANGGVMMRPRLVSEIDNADGVTMSTTKPKAYGTVVDPEITREIIPMLKQVCTEGTASSYMAEKEYSVAGKTGTAEYDNNGNCNSWFVGFSNVEDPDIVVSVIVEDYTTNQTSGTYVASKIMDAYYTNIQ